MGSNPTSDNRFTSVHYLLTHCNIGMMVHFNNTVQSHAGQPLLCFRSNVTHARTRTHAYVTTHKHAQTLAHAHTRTRMHANTLTQTHAYVRTTRARTLDQKHAHIIHTGANTQASTCRNGHTQCTYPHTPARPPACPPARPHANTRTGIHWYQGRHFRKWNTNVGTKNNK